MSNEWPGYHSQDCIGLQPQYWNFLPVDMMAAVVTGFGGFLEVDKAGSQSMVVRPATSHHS